MSRSSEKTARELEAFAKRERRTQARKRLKELRATLVRARAERKEKIRSAAQLCRDKRATLRVRAKQARAELQLAISHERHAQRHQCQASRDATREQTLKKIAGAGAGVVSAKDALRLLARAPKATRAAASTLTSSEQRAESDAQVRANVPHELLGVWDKVKKHIHANPRRSRTEGFLEWVQENGARVYELQHEAHAKWLRDMEREEREHGRGAAVVVPARLRVTEEWGGASP